MIYYVMIYYIINNNNNNNNNDIDLGLLALLAGADRGVARHEARRQAVAGHRADEVQGLHGIVK